MLLNLKEPLNNSYFLAMTRPQFFRFVIALLSFVSSFAFAKIEVIYKSVELDGGIVYSSEPQKDAKIIEILTLSPEERRAALLLEKKSKSEAKEIKEREMQWARADQEIMAAQQALRQAEADLQRGRTPLAHERRGTVSGYSRLTDAYFQRIRKLEAAVQHAKQRLDRAYDARNAL